MEIYTCRTGGERKRKENEEDELGEHVYAVELRRKE